MIDVSGLTSAARPIVREVAAVYLKHTTPWFIGLIVHGSAVKGGVIPGAYHLIAGELPVAEATTQQWTE